MNRISGSAIAIGIAVLLAISSLPVWNAGAAPERGRLLIVDTAFRGNRVRAEVLALRGSIAHVLIHNRHETFYSLVPSPGGRHVAFLSCCSPAAAGVWAFNRDGTNVHRILRLPPSPCGNPLAIGDIAWAPDGRQLASTVFLPSDAIRACPHGVRDTIGTWITSYDHPQPRQLTFGGDAQTIGPISWSPDGRTLAVNENDTVRAVDVATGTSRTLIRGGYQGVFAPVTGTLAYVTGDRIWVAGTEGRHRHVLVSTPLKQAVLTWSPDGRSLAYLTDTGILSRRGVRTLGVAGALVRHERSLVVEPNGVLDSPAWSPDSRKIAYVGGNLCHCGGTTKPQIDRAIFSVDVVTGTRHLILGPRQPGAGLLPRSQLTTVAWTVK